MGAIKSDISAASDAVSMFNNSGQVSNTKFELGESNIAGMKRAAEVSNSIIEDLTKLQSSIKTQADKFPKLAAVIEERDKQDAVALTDMSWGF
ncbi:hypothetical protein [Lactococcus ileimucosae]|uniref:TIGR04197 family type VII secretion effector n=1 Tax=Lactococcus ileimucosae TaxID=2941329 RepID=A0ABV4D184_9LACT